MIIVLVRLIFMNYKSLHRIREEMLKYIQGCWNFDPIAPTLHFEPSLFKQTWPHLDFIDGLRKQWAIIMAKNIIIDENMLVLSIYVHIYYMQSIWVRLCQDELLN